MAGDKTSNESDDDNPHAHLVTAASSDDHNNTMDNTAEDDDAAGVGQWEDSASDDYEEIELDDSPTYQMHHQAPDNYTYAKTPASFWQKPSIIAGGTLAGAALSTFFAVEAAKIFKTGAGLLMSTGPGIPIALAVATFMITALAATFLATRMSNNTPPRMLL